MHLKNLTLILLLFAGLIPARSQTYNPNIDFETGTTAVWYYFTGTCCPIVTPTTTPALPTRHTLTSGATLDPYGLFPIVSPDGGNYSLQLGNSINGAQSEKARYYIHIPTGVSNYSLIYRYAVVFENPTHTPLQQPRFEVRAYDSITNTALPCAQFSYVASSGLPGFRLSTLGSNVYYKDWTSGSINLSGLGGSTIIIDFASGDCSLGGHFGYGYLDMTSGLFAISTVNCGVDSITLAGPAGFNTYYWYDSTTGILIDSTQTIRIPNPPSPVTFTLIMLPYPGYGCPDTLHSRIVPSHLNVQASNDTIVCPGTSISLSANATDIALPLTYAWTPITGLGCSTCDTTIAIADTTTTYIVTVTNSLGCIQSDTVKVSILMSIDQGNDTVLCAGDSTMLHAAATSLAPPLTYLWSPASGLSCITCANPVANPPSTTDYIVSVTDAAGCTMHDTIRISRADISLTSANDVIICDMPVTLNAVAAGSALPFNYNWFPSTGLSCTGCPDPVAGPAVTTVYVVSITDSIGCNVKDTVNVSVSNLLIAPSGNVTICAGETVNLRSGATGNALTYTWSPAEGLNCTTCADPVAQPAASAGYGVIVTDSLNCTKSAVINISIDTLTLDPGRDTTICRGYPLLLVPDIHGTALPLKYAWTPPAGLSCADCAISFTFTQKTTTYLLTVTDANNCTVTDSIKVTIDPCDIFFPNAFTPNGDGINDIIKVVGHLNYFTDFSLNLYNRWGERVYYTEDIRSGWDGVYNGQTADLGTYFYMILYTLYGNKNMMKGDFTLIR